MALPRRKRNFAYRSDRPNRELAGRTDFGRERFCDESEKRTYSSKGQAVRAATDRWGMTGDAYRCPSCDRWHCTRAQTPLDADWRDRASPAPSTEISDPELEALADALVALLGIGTHDDSDQAA